MRYVLVIQWTASSVGDYESLVQLENLLEDALEPDDIVDGHDFGSGEMNIFVLSDDPFRAFVKASSALVGTPFWGSVRAAWRRADGEIFTILWPPDLDTFSLA